MFCSMTVLIQFYKNLFFPGLNTCLSNKIKNWKVINDSNLITNHKKKNVLIYLLLNSFRFAYKHEKMMLIHALLII
jgi:hypothetical protein